MLFKFKSKASADLIMLEPDGRRILQCMIGVDSIKGIVLVKDLPAALAKLEAAVAQDEATRQERTHQAQARTEGQNAEVDDQESNAVSVRLAQRAVPMMQLLRTCIQEEVDLVWGV